jgi:hypothetical protein
VKQLFWLSLLFVLLHAKDNQQLLSLQCQNGTVISTKIILQALQAMGQKVKITKTIREEQQVYIELTISSNKPFESRYFGEILQEHGIFLTKAILKDKKRLLIINASQARWEIPKISPDEGGQIEKGSIANWFRVDESSALTIEAPYNGKWYPEIALFDGSMTLLASVREFRPKTKMEFSLPQGATYLKVSNANGMKLLKEGTYIEHIHE